MVQQLLSFGLTRQEATLYQFLLSEEELTGYEAAKLTGISKSNTYGALAGLVEKGAAYIIEGTVTKYTPVKLEEFCNNKLRSLETQKQALLLKLPEKRPEINGYITIKGKQHIIDKMKNMITEAQERIYLSVSDKTLKIIQEEITQIVKRGIKLVIITNEPYTIEHAKIYYSKKTDHQIRLIVDSKKVLTGDISQQMDSACLYSKNKNLVDVFKEMLQNEIKLIEFIQ